MTRSPEEISEFIKDLDRDTNALTQQIIDICYWMRGGVTWDQAWAIDHISRKKIITMINKTLQKMSGDGREYM
jgi:hypothetical protein